ncbi:MAG: hypothetical protein OEW09_06605 [Anaerolineae bacterium]|nr:hypothetical protein [Anaerolineae bacterium]
MGRSRTSLKRRNISLDPRQREILGLLLLALGALTLLSLLNITPGTVSGWWAGFLRRLFGWGAFPVALALGAGGVILLVHNLQPGSIIGWKRVIGLELVFLADLALAHLLSPKPDPLQLAHDGGGGGYVGWAISSVLSQALGSRVVLDTGGAERLLGRGDMLYMASDSSKLVRLQGCFVSDKEMEKLVKFWQETSWAKALGEGPRYPWHGLAAEDEQDELLEEAIELLKRHKRASTSFLQRRLRIGYPRAARLMDTLEEQGIVGPPVSGGRSREVLTGDFESVEDSGGRNIGYEAEGVGARSGSG